MMAGKKPMMAMADGGIGAPAPIGGGGADNDADDSMAPPAQNQSGAGTAVAPEAVHYHDEAQSCQTCQFMGDDGQCSVLQMQVSPEGGCSAYQAKSGGGNDLGMMPGEDQGSMGGPGSSQGTSGSFGTS